LAIGLLLAALARGQDDDGSIAAWGYDCYGQCNVPLPNTGFVALAGGYVHGLGLKADGSIVAWGDNASGECNVPLPNTGFVAVAGGGYHSLGLKADHGDLNCDGAVNFGDINPFVLLLCDAAAWQEMYPRCHVLNGDIDADGVVDFGDINPFVALLTGG
jgi:hypothetical protein